MTTQCGNCHGSGSITVNMKGGKKRSVSCPTCRGGTAEPVVKEPARTR